MNPWSEASTASGARGTAICSGSHTMESKSRWARACVCAKRLAKVLLPEPELPKRRRRMEFFALKMTVFLPSVSAVCDAFLQGIQAIGTDGELRGFGFSQQLLLEVGGHVRVVLVEIAVFRQAGLGEFAAGGNFRLVRVQPFGGHAGVVAFFGQQRRTDFRGDRQADAAQEGHPVVQFGVRRFVRRGLYGKGRDEQKGEGERSHRISCVE